MKKIILVIFTLCIAVAITSCSSDAERQQSIMEQADFPAIVVKVEAKDTSKGNSPAGYYNITVKKANGNQWSFTSNVSFAIGDTLTVVIDTSHAFERTMKMIEESEAAFKASQDTTQTNKDTIPTTDTTTNF